MSRLDLSKKFPGYFNKWVLRAGFAVAAVLYIAALWSNGWTQSVAFAQCPDDAIGACRNPFYECEVGEVYQCVDEVPDHLCINGLCDVKYLQPGQEVGARPGWLMRNAASLGFLAIVMSFALNHVLYARKVGSWRFPK